MDARSVNLHVQSIICLSEHNKTLRDKVKGECFERKKLKIIPLDHLNSLNSLITILS